ncbi:MAG TPA: hypothetical protein VK184_01730 [Nostocaceae cyanobacterium]|nr:hypothetical protein [Nostocaceae cyanobacterium]
MLFSLCSIWYSITSIIQVFERNHIWQSAACPGEDAKIVEQIYNNS